MKIDDLFLLYQYFLKVFSQTKIFPFFFDKYLIFINPSEQNFYYEDLENNIFMLIKRKY
jgi:hypothetical protein